MAKRPFYLYRPVADQYPVSLDFRSYPAWLQRITGRKNHTGIDFATPEGTRGYFAIGGIVILVKHHELFGNLVVVESRVEGYEKAIYTYYAHLLDPAVAVDQRVAITDSFGRTGRTGQVTGAHLHFEMRIGGSGQDMAVDPRPYMKVRSTYG